VRVLRLAATAGNDDPLQRLAGLGERMRAALGIQVSQSDVINAALVELEKRYPPPTAGTGCRLPPANQICTAASRSRPRGTTRSQIESTIRRSADRNRNRTCGL
jgi:hypothetical protein